ncbi:MAG: hypothetical protein FJW31_20290 [Acidobacteria bacterium]|nr:hypothetical protein [Acidobacteriota bacterium]
MSSDALLFQESLVDDGARTARPYTVSFSLTMQLIAAAAAISYPMWHIEPLPRVKLRAPSPFINAVKLVDPAPAQPASALGPQMSASNALTAPARVPRGFVAPPPGRPVSSDVGPIDHADLRNFDPGPGVPGGTNIPGALPYAGGGATIVAARPVEKPRSDPPPPATPVRVGGVVKPPLLLADVKPLYPQLARAARI